MAWDESAFEALVVGLLHIQTTRETTVWMPMSNDFGGPDRIHPIRVSQGTLMQVGHFAESKTRYDYSTSTIKHGGVGGTANLTKETRWINIFPVDAAYPDGPTPLAALRALRPGDTRFDIRVERKLRKKIWPWQYDKELFDAGEASIRARRLHCRLEPELIITVWHGSDGYVLRTREVGSIDVYDFYFPGPMTVHLFEDKPGEAPTRHMLYSGVTEILLKSKGSPYHGLHRAPPWPTEP